MSSIEIFHGKLLASSSVLRYAPLLKLDTWEDASAFFLSDRKNLSPCTITPSFCILLQINLRTRIEEKDTLEHFFTTVDVHLAGRNNTWIPWLYVVRSHLIISLWWYIETGRKLMLFSLKSTLNHIFSTVAFVLNLLAILISDTRVFYFQVRISTKLLLNTVEQKSTYVFLPKSFIFWILWKRRHVKALHTAYA